jgi:hypothetical protein
MMMASLATGRETISIGDASHGERPDIAGVGCNRDS